MTIARKTDWTAVPLPTAHAVIAVTRDFSDAEMAVIGRGVVPEQMEDKWFIYWQDEHLFLHRSWTGFCVYVLRFEPTVEGGKAVELRVNRDPEQHRVTPDEQEQALVWYLVDTLLLRLPHPFPGAGPCADQNPIAQWSLIGRAIFGEHPGGDDETSTPPLSGVRRDAE